MERLSSKCVGSSTGGFAILCRWRKSIRVDETWFLSIDLKFASLLEWAPAREH
jgi:hypothetical protein